MKKNMLFRKILVVALIFGLLAATGVLAKGTQETIQGTVEKNDKGTLVIKTDAGPAYMVLGQNLMTLVGKTVKATGTLSQGKATRSITVMTFEEVK